MKIIVSKKEAESKGIVVHSVYGDSYKYDTKSNLWKKKLYGTSGWYADADRYIPKQLYTLSMAEMAKKLQELRDE